MVRYEKWAKDDKKTSEISPQINRCQWNPPLSINRTISFFVRHQRNAERELFVVFRSWIDLMVRTKWTEPKWWCRFESENILQNAKTPGVYICICISCISIWILHPEIILNTPSGSTHSFVSIFCKLPPKQHNIFLSSTLSSNDIHTQILSSWPSFSTKVEWEESICSGLFASLSFYAELIE